MEEAKRILRAVEELHDRKQVSGASYIDLPRPLRLPFAPQDIDDEGQVNHHLAIYYRGHEIARTPHVSPGRFDPISEPARPLPVLPRFQVQTPHPVTLIEEALDRPASEVAKRARQ